MAALPAPGTFRLYPFARPPLPAGPYTLTGDVSGLPGAVESLQTAFDVTAPRYFLPPDQVLSTFPPNSARGSFTSRLPQIVLRRRTLPWERSHLTAGGDPLPVLGPDDPAGPAPRPWLALVLIADGEGNLLHDVPVADCVTAPLKLDGDADVPKGTCLEVPETVVAAVFPAVEDLPMLCHVREVDLRDTELAMGDDDGWMAVVLCNRLPQPGTRYTACLINVEGQTGELPVHPALAEDYLRLATVVDHAVIADLLTAQSSADAQGMGLARAATEVAHPLVRSAAASTGATWATTAAASSARSVPAQGVTYQAHSRLDDLATGTGYVVPWHLIVRTVRFPVLASWSFACTEAGDFQTLASQVSSRLLGHVPTGPETPDGEPLPPGPPPTALPTEPPSARPLPLVAPTGHVETAHETRRGDVTTAWFRGPLVPDPVQRTVARPDGRYPVAHHSDQLRRVTPDGHEDLTYAAAYEIGRLLALSQPSVVAALGRWRRERFSAALTSAVADAVVGAAPGGLSALLAARDPYVDTLGRAVAAGAGRRFARGLLSALGEQPADLAAAVPAAPPGFAVDDTSVFTAGRDGSLARGLAVDGVALDVDTGQLADSLWAAAVATGQRDPKADRVVARATLEQLAAGLADTAQSLQRTPFGDQGGPQ
jgi:hypothetical protein